MTVAAGAQASINERGRGEQGAFVEARAGVQAGGIGLQVGGRAAVRGGSGTHPTTVTQGRVRLSAESTSLEAMVTRRAGRGQPSTTARLEARQQLGQGVSAAAYIQQRLQGGERSQTVGVEATGPLTEDANWRASAERTVHSGSHRHHETTVRVGISRQL